MVRHMTLGLLAFSLAACSVKENSSICSTPEQLGEVLKLPHDFANQIIRVDNCLHRWGFRLAGAPGSINDVAQAALGACRDMFGTEALLYAKEGKLPMDQESLDRWEARFRGEGLDLARFYVAMARAGNCAIPSA